MLASVLMELTPAGFSDGTYTGHHAHAWFLGQIRALNPDLAARLHEPGRRKPFTIWSGPRFDVRAGASPACAPDDRHWLRMTSLDPVVGGVVEQLASSVDRVDLGGQVFRPTGVVADRSVHPWSGAESFPGFRERIVGAQPARTRVSLRFLSPTAFARTNGHTLFPSGALVFRSLLERWNAYADARIPDAVANELLAGVREEAYELRTVPLAFDRYRMKGCIGTCEYSVGADVDAQTRVALHLLADFAFYAGVGVKTTMGMGQAIPEPR